MPLVVYVQAAQMQSAADVATGATSTLTPATTPPAEHPAAPRVDHILCASDGPAAQVLASHLQMPVVRGSMHHGWAIALNC